MLPINVLTPFSLWNFKKSFLNFGTPSSSSLVWLIPLRLLLRDLPLLIECVPPLELGRRDDWGDIGRRKA